MFHVPRRDMRFPLCMIRICALQRNTQPEVSRHAGPGFQGKPGKRFLMRDDLGPSLPFAQKRTATVAQERLSVRK